jgi:hypothetical protein
MTSTNNIRPGSVVSGPVLPEAIEVLAIVPLGDSLKLIGRGLRTGLARDTVVSPQQLLQLVVSADREPFDGDARHFRLGVEAHRLGLAYEYDPFFSLSIARVDPLPHQLEFAATAGATPTAALRRRRRRMPALLSTLPMNVVEASMPCLANSARTSRGRIGLGKLLATARMAPALVPLADEPLVGAAGFAIRVAAFDLPPVLGPGFFLATVVPCRFSSYLIFAARDSEMWWSFRSLTI